MVVNYDLPLMNERGQHSDTPDIETYIHRIGPRTLFSPVVDWH
jgi:superfamily II DNA/RNA helicase